MRALDKQYFIVFADGKHSQAFLWRDQAVAMVNLCKAVGDKLPVMLVGVTPKPRQKIANNWGKPRRR